MFVQPPCSTALQEPKSALHSAAAEGHVDVVKLLLSGATDVNLLDEVCIALGMHLNWFRECRNDLNVLE